MKKFKGKSNAYGGLIEKYRLEKGYSRSDLSRELDLIDIPISSDELYKIEKQIKIIKDFELIAICNILNIRLDQLSELINNDDEKVS